MGSTVISTAKASPRDKKPCHTEQLPKIPRVLKAFLKVSFSQLTVAWKMISVSWKQNFWIFFDQGSIFLCTSWVGVVRSLLSENVMNFVFDLQWLISCSVILWVLRLEWKEKLTQLWRTSLFLLPWTKSSGYLWLKHSCYDRFYFCIGQKDNSVHLFTRQKLLTMMKRSSNNISRVSRRKSLTAS